MALQGRIVPKEAVTGTLHRLGYNEIQELKAEMEGTIAAAEKATADANEAADVIFTDFNTITQESDVFTFVEPLTYYNNAGERLSNDKYTSYHLLAGSDFSFFFDGVMELLNQSQISTDVLYINVYPGGEAIDGKARLSESFSTEGYTAGFPRKMGMAIKVYKGELLIISLPDDFQYYNGVSFVKGFSCRTTYGEAGMVMADGVQFGKDQVAEVKKITIQTLSEEEEALLDPPNMWPACFELVWENGCMDSSELAGIIAKYPDNYSNTYRVPVTPGRTYKFTPTREAASGQYFAVVDAEGWCLFIALESISEYTVQEQYGGRLPAYIYYAVYKDDNVEDIIFKDGRLSKLQRDAEGAVNISGQAYSRANEARGYALEAMETAGSATATASEAKTTAEEAKTLAEGSNNLSSQAWNRANEAETTANGANKIATDALTTAAAANRKAASALYIASGTANALKGQASGATVGLSDVSPIEHTLKVKLEAPEGVDVQNVKLKTSGKNFFDPSLLIAQGGKEQEDGSIKFVDPTRDINNAFRIYLNTKERIIFSYKYKNETASSTSGVRFMAHFKDDPGSNQYIGSSGASDWNQVVFDSHAGNNKYYALEYIYPECGTSGNDTWLKDIQIEFSSAQTSYDPYNGAEYMPNADGTVDGVKSISPNMVLLTETEGVTIDAEYNRDINKAFQELLQRVEASTAAADE